MQQTVTRKISKEESDRLYSLFEDKGFKIVQNPAQYIVWRASGLNLTASYYSSGSFVVQGTGDMSILDTPSGISSGFIPHAGADEVGKGDYFGPLVVCGVFLENDDVKQLGIMDSKKLSDKKILSIYEKIKNEVKYVVDVVTPDRYNGELKTHQNVSYFLASVHANVARKLVEKYKIEGTEYVVDQFSLNKDRLAKPFKKVNVKLTQFHKGESDLAVACASVIARATFLNEMERMSEKYQMTFPKGATDVINFGREFVSRFGKEELTNVAKISFRTTSSIL